MSNFHPGIVERVEPAFVSRQFFPDLDSDRQPERERPIVPGPITIATPMKMTMGRYELNNSTPLSYPPESVFPQHQFRHLIRIPRRKNTAPKCCGTSHAALQRGLAQRGHKAQARAELNFVHFDGQYDALGTDCAKFTAAAGDSMPKIEQKHLQGNFHEWRERRARTRDLRRDRPAL